MVSEALGETGSDGLKAAGLPRVLSFPSLSEEELSSQPAGQEKTGRQTF